MRKPPGKGKKFCRDCCSNVKDAEFMVDRIERGKVICSRERKTCNSCREKGRIDRAAARALFERLSDGGALSMSWTGVASKLREVRAAA